MIPLGDKVRGLLRRGPTAAVVQFEAVHEEVIPSVCHALRENGITPTVFLNQEIANRRGDLFAEICPGEFDYHYVALSSTEDWQRLRARLDRRRSDAFVFFNTFQRPGIARFAADLHKPVLGIVHNPQLFLSHPDCVSFADRDDVRLLTLADHAASYLIAGRQGLIDRVATLAPVYWGAEPAGETAGESREQRRMIVPGAVNFGNRSYDFIFEAFARTPGLTDRLNVRILGGGPDREALEHRVAKAGLDHAISFSRLNRATGFVDHRDYFDDLRKAAFILPLLPPNRQDYRVYKITAALSTAQGFCIPPLLDRWTEMVYRVPGLAVHGAGLADALDRAAAMPDEAYRDLRAALRDFRARRLRRNLDEAAYLMQGLVTP